MLIHQNKLILRSCNIHQSQEIEINILQKETNRNLKSSYKGLLYHQRHLYLYIAYEIKYHKYIIGKSLLLV